MENYGYLKKVCLNTPETDIDLSDEKTFLDYIRKPQTGFDSEIKYYRWSAQADFNGKEAGIRQILANRHSIYPRNVRCYDAYVVTDEVYEHLIYAFNKHVYMQALDGMRERTIVCNSLSKTYSITGWRLGYPDSSI